MALKVCVEDIENLLLEVGLFVGVYEFILRDYAAFLEHYVVFLVDIQYFESLAVDYILTEDKCVFKLRIFTKILSRITCCIFTNTYG